MVRFLLPFILLGAGIMAGAIHPVYGVLFFVAAAVVAVRRALHVCRAEPLSAPADAIVPAVETVVSRDQLRVRSYGGRTTFQVGGLPASLSIVPKESRRTVPSQAFASGDPVFDGKVWVQGPTLVCRTTLDASARHAFLDALQRLPSLSVSDGKLNGSITRMVDADDGEELGERLLALAHLLSPALSSPQQAARLSEMAREDPVAAVRVEALGLLAARFPEATREAALACMQDPSAEVRLPAAKLAGADGVPVLAAIVADGSVSEPLRLQALRLVAPHLPPDRLLELIAVCLQDSQAMLQAVAAEIAGDTQLPGALPLLAAALQGSATLGTIAGPAMRSRIASALGAFGPEGEIVLLPLLDDAEDNVRAATAEALGACGTAAAVPPLFILRSRLDAGGEAAALALSRIRERLGESGATTGQLALAEPVEGQLSLAASGGELSPAATKSRTQKQGA